MFFTFSQLVSQNEVKIMFIQPVVFLTVFMLTKFLLLIVSAENINIFLHSICLIYLNTVNLNKNTRQILYKLNVT